MLTEPKLPRLLLNPYGTYSSSIMGYPKRSCWIKVRTLKVCWWLISVCWWGPKRYGLAHTTHRLMANVRGSTPPWLACWGHGTPREEIRVEKPHWNVSPHLQLYPEFSYWVQPLLPHVWEITLAPSRCDPWFSTSHNYGTQHIKICAQDVGTCEMGS